MAMHVLLQLICVTYLIHLVIGNTYLHFPRGSNNRLDEKSANRRNYHRIFDSQNNNRGGYNVGDETDRPAGNDYQMQHQMTFFSSGKDDIEKGETGGKSHFPVEWTQQHGCGRNTEDDPIKVDCQVILQFMCQPEELGPNDSPGKSTIRDGTSTDRNDYRVPLGARYGARKELRETASMAEYRAKRLPLAEKGMHESFEFKDKCEARPRNKGLFTADRPMFKDTASATRQNPNGNAYGYECAEERDYYPYWHPSPWKDVAILVEDTTRCPGLVAESFNTKPKHECVQNFRDSDKPAHYSFAETEARCAQVGGKWVAFHNYLEKLKDSNGNKPASENACKTAAAQAKISTDKVEYAVPIFGTEQNRTEPDCLVKLDPPECLQAKYSRVNHLGNVAGDTLQTNHYDWKLPNFPSGEGQRCVFRLRYNISTEDYSPDLDASANGRKNSPVTMNPEVPIDDNLNVRLAVDTRQFGRTFQDRSHVFLIKERPAKVVPTQELHNLAVRGKRGNIVQTFPAVEYDFVPKKLRLKQKDAVHIHWTGSNTHVNSVPGGDGDTWSDGQGNRGTDRNNIVTMKNSGMNFFTPLESQDSLAANAECLWSAKPVGQGTPIDIGLQLASSGHYTCFNCSDPDSFERKKDSDSKRMDPLLNNAPASFDGMVLQFKEKKKHIIGCTRNNNFSNRSQKGEILVE